MVSNLLEVSGILNLFSLVFNLAVIVCTVLGLWKTFEKAHEPGWASLIPFYGTYVLFKIGGKKKLFWWNLALTIVLLISYIGLFVFFVTAIIGAFSGGGGDFNNLFWGSMAGLFGLFFLMGICAIVILIFRILLCIALAKSFGLSGGYAVGLIFLPCIFYLILGFSDSIYYVGPNGIPQAPYMQPYPSYGTTQQNPPQQY